MPVGRRGRAQFQVRPQSFLHLLPAAAAEEGATRAGSQAETGRAVGDLAHEGDCSRLAIHGPQSHSYAAQYILYGGSLMKYTKWRPSDFTTHGSGRLHRRHPAAVGAGRQRVDLAGEGDRGLGLVS